MALDDTAVGDGLVDDDPVRAVEQLAQGGGDEDRVDALSALGLRLGLGDRRLLGREAGLLRDPAFRHGRLVEVLRPLGELAQGVGDVALQVPVGEQDLVGDVRALRHLVDDDDGRLGGAARRRVEGGPAVDEEDEVRLVHPGADVAAGVQWVGAREVAADRRVGLDDRDVPGLGEGDECLEAARLAPGRLSDDDRVLRLADQLGDGVDLFGRAVRRAGLHDRLGFTPVPLLKEDLQRDVEVRRSRRGAPGEFRRARHHRRKGVDAGGLVGPLGEGLGDLVRAADDGQVAVPLAARVLSWAVAVRGGLRGADHHRDAREQRAVDGHGALEETGGGVQQDALRPAFDQSVAGGHADGDGLVGQVKVLRAGQSVAVAAGEGLPDGGPLGARRTEDVVGADGVEGGHESVAAVGARGVGGVGHLSSVLSPRSASSGPRRFRGP